LQQLEISTALVFKLLDRTVTGDGAGLDSSDSVWVPSFIEDNLGFPQKQHLFHCNIDMVYIYINVVYKYVLLAILQKLLSLI